MSQSFTRGVPIDTDPTLANNSNLLVPSQYAIKTYVDNLVGVSGSGPIIVNVTTTPYTVTPITGNYIYLVDATAGNITMNFPSAVGNNAIYTVKKIDSSANTVTLDASGTETIDGQLTQTIRFKNTSVDLFSNNSNLFIR